MLDSWTIAVDYKIEAEARLECDKTMIKDRSSTLQLWRCELWRNQAICDSLLRLWVDDLKDYWKVTTEAYCKRENLNELMILERKLSARLRYLSSVWFWSNMLERMQGAKQFVSSEVWEEWETFH